VQTPMTVPFINNLPSSSEAEAGHGHSHDHGHGHSHDSHNHEHSHSHGHDDHSHGHHDHHSHSHDNTTRSHSHSHSPEEHGHTHEHLEHAGHCLTWTLLYRCNNLYYQESTLNVICLTIRPVTLRKGASQLASEGMLNKMSISPTLIHFLKPSRFWKNSTDS
jgi:hypothetical protein